MPAVCKMGWERPWAYLRCCSLGDTAQWGLCPRESSPPPLHSGGLVPWPQLSMGQLCFQLASLLFTLRARTARLGDSLPGAPRPCCAFAPRRASVWWGLRLTQDSLTLTWSCPGRRAGPLGAICPGAAWVCRVRLIPDAALKGALWYYAMCILPTPFPTMSTMVLHFL